MPRKRRGKTKCSNNSVCVFSTSSHDSYCKRVGYNQYHYNKIPYHIGGIFTYSSIYISIKVSTAALVIIKNYGQMSCKLRMLPYPYNV